MKKNLLFLTVLFSAMTQLYSQDSISTSIELSELRKNKYHIDVGVSNILNGLSGAGIIFKKKYDAGKFVSVNSIKLLRAALWVNAEVNFQNYFKDTLLNSEHPVDNVDLRFGLGWERQFVHKRLIHYFGVDAITSFYKKDYINNYGYYNNGQQNVYISYVYRTSNSRLGLNPFFGVKYYFTSYLSIGIETGFEISYYRYRNKEYLRNWTINTQGDRENYEIENVKNTSFSGIWAKFNNVRYVTVGYVF